MYRYLRPLLFELDPERAHTLAFASAQTAQAISPRLIRSMFAYEDDRLRQKCLGLTFPNPLGLAAGFDKNGTLPRFWEALGFGFVEVGSVTHLPSEGNERPRMFRLPGDRALINRMGLNNDGAHTVAERLHRVRPKLQKPLGINVAKTHDPSIMGDDGIRDFCSSFKELAPLADYVTLNVSCPNTREGTTFEEPDTFRRLAEAVAELRRTLPHSPAVLIKLSPPSDLPIRPDHPVSELTAAARRYEFDGFVATNTASDRRGLTADGKKLERIGSGGLSGPPLSRRATALVRYLYRRTAGELPIIGVGGIDSAETAYERIKAGASLLQLYTALIYEGPGLVQRIKRGLAERLEADGFRSVTEAVGIEAGEA